MKKECRPLALYGLAGAFARARGHVAGTARGVSGRAGADGGGVALRLRASAHLHTAGRVHRPLCRPCRAARALAHGAPRPFERRADASVQRPDRADRRAGAGADGALSHGQLPRLEAAVRFFAGVRALAGLGRREEGKGGWEPPPSFPPRPACARRRTSAVQPAPGALRGAARPRPPRRGKALAAGVGLRPLRRAGAERQRPWRGLALPVALADPPAPLGTRRRRAG